MKKIIKRSDCPVSYAMDLFGDKWSLLIIRDIVFYDKQFFKEFRSSKEKIASNILSDRIKKLESAGILVSEIYEKQRSQKVYSLTQKGIDLVPVLVEIMIWSAKYDNELAITPEFQEAMEHDREGLISRIKEKLIAGETRTE
ncbi:MAG: helix-turn-helix domain-containing protein [Bacteroidota bacterium]